MIIDDSHRFRNTNQGVPFENGAPFSCIHSRSNQKPDPFKFPNKLSGWDNAFRERPYVVPAKGEDTANKHSHTYLIPSNSSGNNPSIKHTTPAMKPVSDTKCMMLAHSNHHKRYPLACKDKEGHLLPTLPLTIADVVVFGVGVFERTIRIIGIEGATDIRQAVGQVVGVGDVTMFSSPCPSVAAFFFHPDLLRRAKLKLKL